MAMEKSRIEKLSTVALCDYLNAEIPTLSKDVVSLIQEHKIDGGAFVELEDESLKEIAPLLGDRLKLKRIIKAALAREVRYLLSKTS